MYYFTWQDGQTPLMTASQEGHVEMVETLLQSKAKVDLQDEVG